MFRSKLDQLREVVSDPSSKWESSNRQRDLEEINGIEEILNSSETTRDFFKGVVIPVIYSGGKEGVIKQLQSKKNANVNDPLNNLSNRQIDRSKANQIDQHVLVLTILNDLVEFLTIGIQQ